MPGLKIWNTNIDIEYRIDTIVLKNLHKTLILKKMSMLIKFYRLHCVSLAKFCIHSFSLAKFCMREALYVSLSLKTSYDTEKNVRQFGRIWFEAQI